MNFSIYPVYCAIGRFPGTLITFFLKHTHALHISIDLLLHLIETTMNRKKGNHNACDKKSSGLSSERVSTATFPSSLHNMLQEASSTGFDSVISWLTCGDGFEVHDKEKFRQMVLGTYFKQSRYKSFTKQLNLYGFERVSPGKAKCGYRHKFFHRDNASLCRFITREGAKARKRDSNPSLSAIISAKCLLVKPNMLYRSEKGLHAIQPEPINSKTFGHIPPDIAEAIVFLFH